MVVFIPIGCAAHFTGEVTEQILGVYQDEEKAKKRGSEWAKETQQWFKEQNNNIHTSYRIEKHYMITR